MSPTPTAPAATGKSELHGPQATGDRGMPTTRLQWDKPERAVHLPNGTISTRNTGTILMTES